LVNVIGNSSVPAEILNLSDEPEVLQPHTVVVITRPVHNVTEIKLPEDATGSHTEPQQAQCQGQGLEMDEKELPEPLQE